MRRFSTGSAFRIKGRKSNGLRGWKGKPLHPPLTDIPVAAYVIGPVLDVIAFVGRDNAWAPNVYRAAGYVLLAGAIVAVPTALTGFLDWLDTDRGTEIRRMANAHMLTMVTVTTLVLANLGVRFLGDTGDATNGLLFGLSIAIAVLVVAGAAIGGSMVYDYGFNVATAKDHPVYHPDADREQASGGRERLRRTG